MRISCKLLSFINFYVLRVHRALQTSISQISGLNKLKDINMYYFYHKTVNMFSCNLLQLNHFLQDLPLGCFKEHIIFVCFSNILLFHGFLYQFICSITSIILSASITKIFLSCRIKENTSISIRISFIKTTSLCFHFLNVSYSYFILSIKDVLKTQFSFKLCLQLYSDSLRSKYSFFQILGSQLIRCIV